MSVTTDDKRARRREWRDIANFLRSDLYEPSRNYSEVNEKFHAGKGPFTCEIKDIPTDHEREVLWGSPLGWRVMIRLEESMDKERIVLNIYEPNGDHYKGPFVFDEFEYGVGVNWLENNLP